MGLQYAFPGLMTPRPVNFETRIIADEDGSLSLLLHVGDISDRVNYCIMVGGNRMIGYIKDPSYKYVDGLDKWPSKNEFVAPQFSYISSHLPSGIKIPKIDVNGCPVPIDELYHGDSPAYFILKLQATGLPIGDSIVEVAINGKRRNYIVTRPDFHMHRKHGHNLGKLYEKLLNLDEGQFSVVYNNGQKAKIDMHTNIKKVDGRKYYALMVSNEAVYTPEYTWDDNGWITIDIDEGLLPGEYTVAIAWRESEDNWHPVIWGDVTITDRNFNDKPIEVYPGVERTVMLDPSIFGNPEIVDIAAYKVMMYTSDMETVEMLDFDIVDGKLLVHIPAMQDDGKNWEWASYYSLYDGAWVPMFGGKLIVESQEDVNAYDSIRKITDYLYEVKYSTLDNTFADYYFHEKDIPVALGACTSLRYGNQYGRNFDWLYNDSAEFVVHTSDVVGIAANISPLTEEFVNAGKQSAMYKIVPFMLVDGINGNGLVCSTNVVPDNGSRYVTPTNGMEVELCSYQVVRFILDNFKTAREAAYYISEHAAIYHPYKLIEDGYNQHYMIADENDTYVLEFVGGKAVILEVSDLHAIITNFHIADIELLEGDSPIATPASFEAGITGTPGDVNGIEDYGSGLERYNLAHKLLKDYNNVSEIMPQLRYTRAYSNSEDPASPRWDTEFVHTINATVNDKSSSYDPIQRAAAELYEERDRKEAYTWQTVHTSVYDIENRALKLNVQENYNTTYEFNITDYD